MSRGKVVFTREEMDALVNQLCDFSAHSVAGAIRAEATGVLRESPSETMFFFCFTTHDEEI